MKEFNEAITFLGYDPENVKTVEEFKTVFESEFIRKSAIKDNQDILAPIIGKRMGSIQTDLKRSAKEYGIDFEGDEFKGKPVEEQTKLLIHKMAENNLKTVTELQAKVGQSNDEAIKEWQTKFEKVQKTLSEKESLLNDTVSKYQTLEQNSANEIKNFKLSSVKEKLWNDIKFKTGISDIEKKGFDSHVKENFVFELGDNDKFEIRAKDGKPIPSTKVTGSFREPLEVLQEEAVKLNLFALNDNKTPIAKQGVQQQIIQAPARKVFMNPNLRSQK